MKYRIMSNIDPSGCEKDRNALFIMPRGPEPSDFLIVYPKNLQKSIRNLLVHPHFEIRIFQGAYEEEIDNVKERLIDEVDKKLHRLISRGSNWFAAGIVIAVFGLINWIIPDPIPLVDEMIMTLGGAAAAVAGFNLRRRGSEEEKRKADIARCDINSAEPKVDPLLTWFYGALKAKSDPREEAEESSGADDIEIESRWLTKYGDFELLSSQGTVQPEEVVCFFRVLKDVFPVRKFLRVRGRSSIRKLQEKYGFTRDAVAVYSSLLEAGREFLRSRGRLI